MDHVTERDLILKLIDVVIGISEVAVLDSKINQLVYENNYEEAVKVRNERVMLAAQIPSFEDVKKLRSQIK